MNTKKIISALEIRVPPRSSLGLKHKNGLHISAKGASSGPLSRPLTGVSRISNQTPTVVGGKTLATQTSFIQRDAQRFEEEVSMKEDLNYQLYLNGQHGFQHISTRTDFQRPVLARKPTEKMYMGLKNKKDLL